MCSLTYIFHIFSAQNTHGSLIAKRFKAVITFRAESPVSISRERCARGVFEPGLNSRPRVKRNARALAHVSSSPRDCRSSTPDPVAAVAPTPESTCPFQLSRPAFPPHLPVPRFITSPRAKLRPPAALATDPEGIPPAPQSVGIQSRLLSAPHRQARSGVPY